MTIWQGESLEPASSMAAEPLSLIAEEARASTPKVSRRPTRRRLIAAVGAQLLVRGVGLSSGVVVAAVLARSLGHGDFGRFSLVLSLAAIAATLSDLGIASTAVRHLAVNPDSAPTTAGALVLARALTGMVGAIFVVLVTLAIDQSRDVLLASSLIAASLLFAPLTALQPIGQARLRIGAMNGLLLLQSGLWTVAVLVLASGHAALWGFAAGSLAVTGLHAVVNWMTFRRHTSISFAGAGSHLKSIMRIAWPVGVGGLFVTAYYRLDGVILYHYRGPLAAADFSAAYRFLDVLQFIPVTLLSVLLPLLASTWRGGDAQSIHRRQRLFDLSLTLIVGVALPVAVGSALTAGNLISLIYGAEFSKATNLVTVLMAAFPAICLGYVSVGLALASARTVLYAKVTAFAALGNIALNVWLIPRYGASAAAWTTVVTEYVVAILLLVLLARKTRVALPWRAWFGIAAASCCMGAVVFPLRHAPLALSVSVGVASYLVSASLLRVLRISDIRAVTSRRKLENL